MCVCVCVRAYACVCVVCVQVRARCMYICVHVCMCVENHIVCIHIHRSYYHYLVSPTSSAHVRLKHNVLSWIIPVKYQAHSPMIATISCLAASKPSEASSPPVETSIATKMQ